jgi:SAM-dependent methyltransferase
VGSLDVNSSEQGLSVRDLCREASAYIGIDQQDGPGVDIVCSARDYASATPFDVVISTEAMEHTPDPQSILDCAWRSLVPYGLLVLTCAGPGRTPHGCSGGAVGDEYYQNIDPASLRVWLRDWDDVTIVENQDMHDVYATAVKPKA